jgi:uncharacterized protein
MNVLKKTDIIRTLTSVLPEARQRFKVKSLALFGSAARGQNRPESDIDVLADFEEGADLFDFTGAAEFLEQKFQHKVDLVSRGGVRDEMKDAIFNEAILA